MAHSFGIVEAATGTFDGALLRVTSEALTGTPTAKEVARVDRSYELGDDTVAYTIRMAAVGVPLTHHLQARLRRSASGDPG